MKPLLSLFALLTLFVVIPGCGPADAPTMTKQEAEEDPAISDNLSEEELSAEQNLSE